MSMLNQILSQVMSRAAGKRQGGTTTAPKEDPNTQAARQNWYEVMNDLIKDPNVSQQQKAAWIGKAPEGVDASPYTDLANVKLPVKPENQMVSDIFNYALKQQHERITPGTQARTPLPGEPTTPPPRIEPVTEEVIDGTPFTLAQPENQVVTPSTTNETLIPTQRLTRKGPVFKITKMEMGADGEPKITFNNAGIDGEDYIERLQDEGAINPTQARGMRIALYKAKYADLTDDIEQIVPKFDEHAGKFYTQVIFKDGTSRVIPAAGASLTPKPQKGKAYINKKTGKIEYFSEEPGSKIPSGYELLGDPSSGKYTPEQINALNNALSEGRLDPRRINSRTGYLFAELELAAPGRTDYEGISADILEKRRKVLAQTGTRAQTLNNANDLFQKHLQEVIDLRKAINPKYLPQSGQLRSMNKVMQWFQRETGDATTAKFRGKALLLADALQRVFGSGQGGEWAFAAARELLDPTLSPEAFEARMRAHAEDLSDMAQSARTFGDNPVATSTPETYVAPKGASGVFPAGTLMPDGTKIEQDTEFYSDGEGGWLNEEAFLNLSKEQ